MGRVNRFEDLECWKEARELVKQVYQACNHEPLNKDFDTRNQFKRAALGIMNNIAEGFARYSQKDFTKFLDYAQSSASEVKSMLYVLQDQAYLNTQTIQNLHDQTDKTRNYTLALIRYLNNQTNKNSKSGSK